MKSKDLSNELLDILLSDIRTLEKQSKSLIKLTFIVIRVIFLNQKTEETNFWIYNYFVSTKSKDLRKKLIMFFFVIKLKLNLIFIFFHSWSSLLFTLNIYKINETIKIIIIIKQKNIFLTKKFFLSFSSFINFNIYINILIVLLKVLKKKIKTNAIDYSYI